ncbi:MAG: hypothetical protein HY275_13880 [Gemmatimonadetes bacterium]|nr:hypothetical protein [Gemmatimonadota bacterium]
MRAAGAQDAPPTGAQNPPSVRWEALTTSRFELIYPRELSATAQRIARRLEAIAPAVARTYGVSPDRLPLVLQNRGTLNNGFVALAPRHSEWFTTAPQAAVYTGPNDWLGLLATHEYRHVAQFDKMRRGFVGLLNSVFGETGWLFAANVALPPWVWEGDAVGIETALTPGGRGRIPEFNVEQRALTLEKPRPDYWTAYFRSYGTFVPDHYQLGYALTSYLTRTQGPAAWDSIIGRTADRAWLPWGFSASLREVTGKGDAETYASAMDSLRAAWRTQQAGFTLTAATPAHRLDSAGFSWTEYPQFDADGSIIAFRRGLDFLYHFTRITPGDSTAWGREMFTPAPYVFGVPHSVGGGRLTYGTVRYDARWGQRQWSIVRVRDLATGDEWTLGDTTRLFAPALSADGQRIAAVEQALDGTVTLVVLDARTGAEQLRLPNPGNAMLQLPRWAPDGEHLVVVRTTEGEGRRIQWVDLATRSERTLVAPTALTVQAPVTDGRFVYFVSPRSGVDNIYAVAVADGRQWQVTSRPVSATQPAVSRDGRTLAFGEMTGDGQRLATMPLDSGSWVPLAQAREAGVTWAEELAARLGPRPALDTAAGEPYPVREYHPWAHALNFYGLTMAATPGSPVTSAALSSRDLLGTASAAIGVRYNTDERAWGVGANATYAGWWPVIDASFFRDQRQSTYLYRDSAAGPIKEARYRWSELNATLGFRLPLNLTDGLYSTFLTLGGAVTARRTADQPVNFRETTGERLLTNGTFLPVTWFASMGRGYQTYRDLQPVWGQYLVAIYQHTPLTRSVNSGALFAARGYLYFPGFLRHHGIMIEGGYERQWAGNYFFGSQMVFPRGYSAVAFDRFQKVAFNYALPLDYPDTRLLRAVQVQRVRANFFYDIGVGDVLPSAAFPTSPSFTSRYTSGGVEVMADTHLWQFPAPIGVGFRTSYLNELKVLRTSLILQVDF